VPNARRSAYGLAEPGHAQHHQPGIDLVEHVRTEPPLLHHAGPEVLHDHVRLGGQPAQQVLPFGLAEVQGHRVLVARDHLPPQAVPFPVPAVRARRVALGMLDLDDLGAAVGQQHGGDRGA
jgi:hypothetical protein